MSRVDEITYEIEQSALRFYDHDHELRMGGRSVGDNIFLYPRTGTLTDIIVPDGYRGRVEKKDFGMLSMRLEGSRYTFIICNSHPDSLKRSTITIRSAASRQQ